MSEEGAGAQGGGGGDLPAPSPGEQQAEQAALTSRFDATMAILPAMKESRALRGALTGANMSIRGFYRVSAGDAVSGAAFTIMVDTVSFFPLSMLLEGTLAKAEKFLQQAGMRVAGLREEVVREEAAARAAALLLPSLPLPPRPATEANDEVVVVGALVGGAQAGNGPRGGEGLGRVSPSLDGDGEAARSGLPGGSTRRVSGGLL